MCSYQKRNPFPIRIPICLTQLFQRTFDLIIEIAQHDKWFNVFQSTDLIVLKMLATLKKKFYKTDMIMHFKLKHYLLKWLNAAVT